MSEEITDSVVGVKLTIPVEFEILFDPRTGSGSLPVLVEKAKGSMGPDKDTEVGYVSGGPHGKIVVDVGGYKLTASPLPIWRAVEGKLLELRNVWAEKQSESTQEAGPQKDGN